MKKQNPAYQAAYYQANAERLKAYKREWHAANKEKTRIIGRRKKGMLNPTGELRGGACEICQRVFPTLNLDHDHTTGLTRGWLCTTCNMRLATLEDAEWTERALNYLKGTK
jgi:hypothetical protein